MSVNLLNNPVINGKMKVEEKPHLRGAVFKCVSTFRIRMSQENSYK